MTAHSASGSKVHQLLTAAALDFELTPVQLILLLPAHVQSSNAFQHPTPALAAWLEWISGLPAYELVPSMSHGALVAARDTVFAAVLDPSEDRAAPTAAWVFARRRIVSALFDAAETVIGAAHKLDVEPRLLLHLVLKPQVPPDPNLLHHLLLNLPRFFDYPSRQVG